jgi:hypothetical protein
MLKSDRLNSSNSLATSEDCNSLAVNCRNKVIVSFIVRVRVRVRVRLRFRVGVRVEVRNKI